MDLEPHEVLEDIIARYTSMRDFARTISEDTTDIIRWKSGKRKINARAVIQICKRHKDISPHSLNPQIFPKELVLTFKELT